MVDWEFSMIVICVQTLAPTTGSGLFTNDVINLKHQGAGQKLMLADISTKGCQRPQKVLTSFVNSPYLGKSGIKAFE